MNEAANSTSFHYYLVQGITLARIPLAIVAALILLAARPATPADYPLAQLLICAVVLLVAELTDAVDGFLARRLNVVSEWGAALDPYSDSVSRIITFWALACAGLALPALPLVMAIRDITIAYCRIQWVRSGRSVSARLSGKLKAVVQGGATFALLAGPLYWSQTGDVSITIISWIVIAVTIWSGLDYLLSGRPAAK